MKQSNYNFVMYDESYSYWYNSLCFSFFRLSKELGKKVESLLPSPDVIKEDIPTFYENLVNKGFLVQDDCDELAIIRERNEASVNDKNYFLIIMPTLNCNYKCWYCIQSHIPSSMSDETIDRLKKHIDYMVDEEKITSLTIDWFGGEPFMYYKRVVEPLSRYAVEKCAQAGITFHNGATTNGYFITSEVSAQFPALNFERFQITLDGNKEFHDKVKFQTGCVSTFDHVLRNISRLLKNSAKSEVLLRINYTHDCLTTDIVEQVNAMVEPELRKRVIVCPRKVWQENVDKSFTSVLEDVLAAFSDSGYMVQHFSPATNYVPCYTSRKYYNAISYNGNVSKCTACNDIYEENPLGILQPDGRITWRDGFDIRYQVRSFENPRCLACKRLPACMGLCARDHLLGATHCKYDAIDVDFEKSVMNFIKSQY